MTAETFRALSARAAALLAKQRRLLKAIREQPPQLQKVKETQLIDVDQDTAQPMAGET